MKHIAFASMVATVLLAAAGAVSYACVPADTRPTPGSLTLTVSPGDGITNGITTSDGWTLRFERVLVGIGGVSLDNECSRYSSGRYDRILDLTKGGTQKLALVYGIGQCDLRFRLSPPSSDALLGPGVSEIDKLAMRAPAKDPYIELGGIAADISGSATFGETTKRFRFLFRPRVRYDDCTAVPDAGPGQPPAAVDLKGEDALTYDIRIEAEALFRDDQDRNIASIRFGPFANADTNGDDLVTLEELRAVPISTIRDGGAFETSTFDFDDAGVRTEGPSRLIESLGDYMYLVLAPTMPRFRENGVCNADIQLTPGRN